MIVSFRRYKAFRCGGPMKSLVVSVVMSLMVSVVMAAKPVCAIEYRSPAHTYDVQVEMAVEVKENTDLAAWVLDRQVEKFKVRVIEVDGRYLANLSSGDMSVHAETEGDLSLSLRKRSEQVTVTCPSPY